MDTQSIEILKNFTPEQLAAFSAFSPEQIKAFAAIEPPEPATPPDGMDDLEAQIQAEIDSGDSAPATLIAAGKPSATTAPPNGGIVLNVIRKSYEIRTEKREKQIARTKQAINALEKKAGLAESDIELLREKINNVRHSAIALRNSNNYLESAKGQSAGIDKILVFLMFANNRRVIEKEQKIAASEKKIISLTARVESINGEIAALRVKISDDEQKITALYDKQVKLRDVEKLGITNPAISFFLTKNMEKIAADIEQFMYKEIFSDEESKLAGMDYTKNRSNNRSKLIIRFDKANTAAFEAALA
ncbi:hypothetical protein FACS1894133_2470 [Clostridia bacterium]|nr:hypothetical protein FACS1894133_2470 [Clostridia bacterium]